MLCMVRSEKGCWVQDRDLVTRLDSEPSNEINSTTTDLPLFPLANGRALADVGLRTSQEALLHCLQ